MLDEHDCERVGARPKKFHPADELDESRPLDIAVTFMGAERSRRQDGLA
jgi:hypothetical protein